jgi:hypothetical protein
VEERIRRDHPDHPNFSTKSFAVWSYWTYEQGYHAAFLLIGAHEKRVSKNAQEALLRFVQDDPPSATQALREKVKDEHFVIITEIVTCSAFASVFIEAKTKGHFFIGFDPSKRENQWTIHATEGSYVPSCYDYKHDRKGNPSYYPLYAMRAFRDTKLPAAKLGFEPSPEVKRLRQDILMNSTHGFDGTLDFWKGFPPDDDDRGDPSGRGGSSGRRPIGGLSTPPVPSDDIRRTGTEDQIFQEGPGAYRSQEGNPTDPEQSPTSDEVSKVAEDPEEDTPLRRTDRSTQSPDENSLVRFRVLNLTQNATRVSISRHGVANMSDDHGQPTNSVIHDVHALSEWSGSIPIPRPDPSSEQGPSREDEPYAVVRISTTDITGRGQQ